MHRCVVRSARPFAGRPFAGLALALAASLAGCGGGADPADEPDDAGAPTDVDEPGAGAAGGGGRAPMASGTPTDDPAKVGTISGVVTFEGTPPAMRPIPGPMNEPGCAHHDETPVQETVVVNDGKLANVVVWVAKGFDESAVMPPPDEPVLLDQHGCIYAPHVVAVREGQTLAVRNSDEATHNVHAKPRIAQVEGGVNRTHQKGAADQEWSFDLAGARSEEVAIELVCDLHPWMKAWVAVFGHPYFDVSAEDGTFSIGPLEPGTYELRTWHEEWTRPKRARVEIPDGGGVVVDFSYED